MFIERMISRSVIGRVAHQPRFLESNFSPMNFGTSRFHQNFSTLSFCKAKKDSKPLMEEKARLGRPSNNLKIGVVGLPNIGKSTFFNAVTNSSVPAENFPFCTIEPEEARVNVTDERFDWLCELYKPKSKVPAYLTIIDIAGLVKGAAGGAGLGNAFLSHIRSVDAIYHLCRAYEDVDVTHVKGKINPTRDLEIIHAELRIKDMEILTKHIDLLSRGSSRADSKKQEELTVCKKVLSWVEDQEMDVRKGNWSAKEIEIINPLHLISAKPVIYLANTSDQDYIKRAPGWIPEIQTWINKNNPRDLLIPFSASLESAVSCSCFSLTQLAITFRARGKRRGTQVS
ncbi:hypothetical protein DSO57_1006731 [Entomophthora muscae]|uniref:Uncharacterized protein n=1 Tax=Entomophthora muscae TaxID=34485 RepID=A0ACC2UTN3_9FUNG|nr:hypothetical protein DSO57_1006731 [Entomophthora muscae]